MTNHNQPSIADWMDTLAVAKPRWQEAHDPAAAVEVLLASRWLLNHDQEHDRDGHNVLELYLTALRAVRAQHLEQAQEHVNAAHMAQTRGDTERAKKGYAEALSILRGEWIDGEPELVQQIRAALLDEAATTAAIADIEKQQAALDGTSPLPPAPAPALADVADPEPHTNSTRSLERNTEMRESSPAPETRTVREETLAEQIEALANEAQSFLQRPNSTRQNYKQALANYTQILAFPLDPEQREVFSTRNAAAEQQYNEFLQTYGELSTAQQVRNLTGQLIATRRLLNADKETDDYGNNLLDQYTKLLQQMRQTHLKQANDQTTFAANDIAIVYDTLAVELLKAAKERYQNALVILRGAQIKDEEKHDTLLEEQIRAALLDDAATNDRIAGIERLIADLEQQEPKLTQVYTLYTQAEQDYQQRQYAQAIDHLNTIPSYTDEHFQSKLITNLRERIMTGWENATATTLNAHLVDIQAMIARHDPPASIDAKIVEAIQLEPNLQTDRIESLRTAIKGAQQAAQQAQQRLNEQLEAVTRNRTAGNLAQAEQEIRAILVQHGTNERAKQLLYDILTDHIRKTLGNADEALQTRATATVEACLKQLAEIESKLGELPAEQQQRWRTQCNERKEDLERHLKKLRQQEQSLSKAKDLIEQATTAAQDRDFGRALERLQEAEKTDPTLRDTIEKQCSQIRADWRRMLKRGIENALEQADPDLTIAQAYLKTLGDEKLHDLDTTALSTRVKQLVQLKQAEQHVARGEYEQALAIFNQLDVSDTAIKSKYQQCLKAAAQRKVESRSWQEALDLLQKAQPSDPDVSLLGAQCRGEIALAEATRLLRTKEFSASREQLAMAEKEVFGDIQERARQLRQQLDTTQTTFENIKNLEDRAQQLQRVYSTSGDRNKLKEAIGLLDQALAQPDLAIDDEQRRELQARRDEYWSTYTGETATERQDRLDKAEQALRAETIEGIEHAYQYYGDVLTLNPDDTEAKRGKERVRTTLRTLRNTLVERTRQLLNIGGIGQRGVHPTAIAQLIQEVERAQRQPDIEPQPHSEINKALEELKAAQLLCHQAETDLSAARTRWAQERARGGSDFHSVELDLARARERFRTHPYIHVELDNSSPDSLTERIKADLKARQEVARIVGEIEALLQAEPRNTLQKTFQLLTEAEESVYRTTIWIAEQTNQPRPQNNRERYPHQARILAKIDQDIQESRRLEQDAPTIADMRAYRSEYTELDRLLEKLDPDNRFTFRVVSTKTDLPDMQLEQAEQSLTAGRDAYKQAKTAEDEAKNVEPRKDWQAGIDAYQRSTKQYEAATEQLQSVLKLLPHNSTLGALNRARSEAESLLQTTSEALQRLQHEQPWQAYERHRVEAQQKLKEAKDAINNNNFESARTLAREAKDIDPALTEEAERAIRDADAMEGEKPTPLGWIILAIVGAILLAAALFFGPGVYDWMVSFFFPAGVTPVEQPVLFIVGIG
ncbi:hypothetical protein HC928_01710 [bacterium]|nr:hypothetical protein [bacterium]